MNIYTVPEYRSRGIASSLINEIISYCNTKHITRLWLHASENGKHVYEKFGFKPKDSEMELFL